MSGVKANFTKRPYDTSVALTVHSLLIVDALQTYGPDFELLVASHKNVWYVNLKGGSFLYLIHLFPVVSFYNKHTIAWKQEKN